MLQAGTMGHRDVTSSCSTWASDPYCGSRASLVTPVEPADAVLEILLSSLDSPSALSDPAARRCNPALRPVRAKVRSRSRRGLFTDFPNGLKNFHHVKLTVSRLELLPNRLGAHKQRHAARQGDRCVRREP